MQLFQKRERADTASSPLSSRYFLLRMKERWEEEEEEKDREGRDEQRESERKREREM